jgi:hypothetical protein
MGIITVTRAVHNKGKIFAHALMPKERDSPQAPKHRIYVIRLMGHIDMNRASI